MNIIDWALGLSVKELNFWQMGLRAVIVYLAALGMVRIVGERRFIGKFAAFDIILTIIFGSTLSRAINGTSAFFETIFAGFVLIIMHWVISAITFHHPKWENRLKGRSRVLIKDGQLRQKTMQDCHITKDDLASVLRLKCQIENLERIDGASLERNGDISFSLKEKLGNDSSS